MPFNNLTLPKRFANLPARLSKVPVCEIAKFSDLQLIETKQPAPGQKTRKTQFLRKPPKQCPKSAVCEISIPNRKTLNFDNHYLFNRLRESIQNRMFRKPPTLQLNLQTTFPNTIQCV